MPGQTWRQLRWSLASSRRRATLAVRRSLRALLPSRRIRLSRFLFAPPDLRTADPTVAADIYAGLFVHAGRVVSTNGQSPFEITPPTEGWAEGIYGFGWLRHLQAANSALARQNARSLVADFIRRGRQTPETAWRPAVITRRLLSFLSQSPLVLDGADHDFYVLFAAGVRQDARRLRDARHLTDDPAVKLGAAIALTTLGLCVEGGERLERRFGEELSDLLDDQILADGGHLSRNPRVLIDLMLDLLPLRSTYAARGLEAPRGVVAAIDRIAPHLKMLRHPEGSIALFNGMGASHVDALATIFTSHDSAGRPATEAPYTGYQRLEADAAVLIVDTGPVPPFEASSAMLAGCLSFEFSHGRQRLIVNCGLPQQPLRDLPIELRATAAHSTSHFADTSTCRFLQRHGETRVLTGPRQVLVRREFADGGERLVLSHDGYQAEFGLEVARELWLAGDGLSLSGREQLHGSLPRGSAEAGFVTRFHLHPSVKAGPLPDGRILLVPQKGASWIFACEGAAASIDDSVFFAAIDGTRRTQQLVLTAVDPLQPVSWRMVRRQPAG